MPVGDQMQNPPAVRPAEGPGAERQAGRVAGHHWDRPIGVLVAEFAEHRSGEIDTDHPSPAGRHRQRERARPHADLEKRTAGQHDIEQVDRGGERGRVGHACPVVVLRGGIEGERPGHQLAEGSIGIVCNSGVAGTEATDHALPEPVGLRREDIRLGRPGHEPGVLGQLLLQLPGAPPRIAGEDTGTDDGVTVRVVHLVGEEADRPERHQSRPSRIGELCDHDRGVGLDRAALEQLLVGTDQIG